MMSWDTHKKGKKPLLPEEGHFLTRTAEALILIEKTGKALPKEFYQKI